MGRELRRGEGGDGEGKEGRAGVLIAITVKYRYATVTNALGDRRYKARQSTVGAVHGG